MKKFEVINYIGFLAAVIGMLISLGVIIYSPAKHSMETRFYRSVIEYVREEFVKNKDKKMREDHEIDA